MKNTRKKFYLFFVLVLAFNLFLGAGDAEHPLIQSLSYFPFFENNMLEKNHYSLSMDMYYSNLFMFDGAGDTFIDMESFTNITAFRFGVSKSLTLELFYRASIVHGGDLDRLTMKVHEILKQPTDRRDEFPINQVNYRYKDYFAYQERTVSPPSILLSAAAEILHKRNFNIITRLGLGIPLMAKPGFASDKPFLCSGLVLNYHKGNFAVEASGYISFFKAPEWMPAEPIRYNIIVREIKGTIGRFSGGYRTRSTPFKEGDLSDAAKQAFIYYRIGKRIEIGLVEDFYPFHTTPDFSFNLKFNLLNGSIK